MAAYRTAIALAEEAGEGAVMAEALRRLAVMHFHRNDTAEARRLGELSVEVAHRLDHPVLAAEGLNTLGGFEFETGSLEAARDLYHRALDLGGGSSPALRARIEQNLGILANIQGDLDEATAHYHRSLEACEAANDQRGRAIALHNLGMACADREHWADADRHYAQSLELALAIGDVHLQGLCLLNHAEVHVARQHFDRARDSAEAALATFDRLGAKLDKADAYKLLGVVYRETGHLALAEARLRAAVDLATQSGSILSEAEASRELGRLYQAMGRNQEALALLAGAHRLFGRLDAQRDLVDVAAKRLRLEETYLAVVRNWGQSIESADSYTFGHCERVATYAMRVAETMQLDDLRITTIRLGAYLHDLGKVKIPHEILNKPGALTKEEFGVMQMHPVWGIELLSAVEFPWDLKPIIRWHHEKYDGTGYPDRLKGDEIPVDAQIICIVDVYDALTTTRSYRAALSHEEALRRMHASSSWWRPDVFAAFMSSVGVNPTES